MDDRIEECRKFFNEVIQDMMEDDAALEQMQQMTRDDRVRLEHEMNQVDGELRESPPSPEELAEPTPAQYRAVVGAAAAEELLFRRRYLAKTVCMCVAQGDTHRIAEAKLLEHALLHLQILDAEIARRHIG
jgi:hypothetical protein